MILESKSEMLKQLWIKEWDSFLADWTDGNKGFWTRGNKGFLTCGNKGANL